MKRKLLSLLLALSLLLSLAAPTLAAETASVIRLTKTTGTVEISKSSGKSVSLLQNMRLYNGYHVSTDEESYAWINLDDSKLLKEDAESEVEIRKDGKNLEVLTVSGNVFFDVARDLEDDESLNIRTSTMAVGIRGTSGWLHVVDRWVTRVSVLEGTVVCSVADPVTGELKSEEIHGGETALCVVYPQEKTGDKSAIIRDKFTVDDIPGFVLADLVRDMALCDKIEAATDLDIPRDLASVAGGDPSGREPDREHATPEVLGEADRREDEDEDNLHEKLEEIEKELEKQPDEVSPDKVVPKPSAPAPSENDSDRDSGGSSGGTTTPAPTPTPPATRGMKLKDVEVQALLADTNNLSIEPNTDAADMTPKKNTLEVDTGLSVASGKTLDLQSGIDLEVYPGKALQVDGTLTADALQNNGTTTVTSGNTLRLRGDLTTSGTLNVTATGRIVVDGTFANSGTVALTSGAAVLAKTFAPGAAPEGWEVSAAADASGYYKLIPSSGDTPAPPEPSGPPYTITFDANGGTAPAPMQTDESGVLASLPTAEYPVTTGEMTFLGWYTEKTGGDEVKAGETFDKGTTLYARWDGWCLDGGKLTATKSAVERNYSSYMSTGRPKWYSYRDSITEVVIPDDVTRIGSATFSYCEGLTSVPIPDSVTSIGSNAFQNCSGLTGPLTIPEEVTSIGKYAFFKCSNLTGDLKLPDKVTSIGESAFYECSNLTGSLTIPEGITSIEEHVFHGCTKLTGSLTIPDSVVSIGGSAFSGCSGLTGPLKIPDKVTSIGTYTFSGCSGLTGPLTIPEKVTSIGGNAFQDCSGFTGPLTIPEGITSIEERAFYGCSGLTGPLTIPEGVTSIGRDAFYNCSGFTNPLTISGKVTSIGKNAFSSTNLTNVVFNGTREQWKGITREIGAISYSATIHCTDGDCKPDGTPIPETP